MFDANFVNNPCHARRTNPSAMVFGKDKQLVQRNRLGSASRYKVTNVGPAKPDNAEIV